MGSKPRGEGGELLICIQQEAQRTSGAMPRLCTSMHLDGSVDPTHQQDMSALRICFAAHSVSQNVFWQESLLGFVVSPDELAAGVPLGGSYLFVHAAGEVIWTPFTARFWPDVSSNPPEEEKVRKGE
eukprot:scaffold205161_cov18-Tisochrysis_lutea.AAC.1